MLERHRRVCLISLLPFLFPGDYPLLNANGPSSIRSDPLPAEQPVGRTASRHSTLPSQHHYHLNVSSDMMAKPAPSKALFVHACERTCILCLLILIKGSVDKL